MSEHVSCEFDKFKVDTHASCVIHLIFVTYCNRGVKLTHDMRENICGRKCGELKLIIILQSALVERKRSLCSTFPVRVCIGLALKQSTRTHGEWALCRALLSNMRVIRSCSEDVLRSSATKGQFASRNNPRPLRRTVCVLVS